MKHVGVFVTASGFLADRPGGAQICTQEYLATLRAAGIQLHIVAHELDNRATTKVLKRLWPSSYFRPTEKHFVDRVIAAVKQHHADFVFLNQVQLAILAGPLRESLASSVRIVVLSHGLESTDLLHSLRFGGDIPIKRYRLGAALLGDTLLNECSYRPNVDLVMCLSPFDVELEHWLGTERAGWLPRVVTSNPLDWNPLGDRVGFVGTLDHVPSIEGLMTILNTMPSQVPDGLRVRVVGAQRHIGLQLERQFPVVNYLGPLSDIDLRREASTWNCFINPIFCLPRGCSTKLATALSWEIPLVTTSFGCRGYVWSNGKLPIAECPFDFWSCILDTMNLKHAFTLKAEVSKVTQSSPTIGEVGNKIASMLDMLGVRTETSR